MRPDTQRTHRDVTSFDFFDTLVHRPALASPKDLFFELAMRSGTDEPERLARDRVRAEHIARRYAHAEGRGEITLSEIYEQLVRIRQEPKVGDLLDLELELERTHVERMPAGGERFDATEGHKIITTDTYLPRSLIEELAEREGYGDATLLVSSELRATKHRGPLFAYLPLRINHVGDSVRGDVVGAIQSGRQGELMPSPQITARRLLGLGDQPSGNPLLSRLLATMLRQNADEPLWRLGTALSYTAVGFALAALQKADREGLDRICFAARDGWLVHNIASLVKDRLSLTVDLDYVHVSRKALYPTLFMSAPALALDRYLHAWENLTLAGCTRRLALPDTVAEAIIGRSGARPTTLVNNAYYELREALTHHWDDVVAANVDAASTAIGYLESAGLLDEHPPLFVDLGWHCSLQQTIEALRTDRGADRRIPGLYLGTFEAPEFPGVPTLDVEGLVATASVPQHRTRVLRIAPSVIEVLFSAPHGTTIGYSRSPSGPSPVIDPSWDRGVEYAASIEALHGRVLAALSRSLENITTSDALVGSPNPEVISALLGGVLGEPSRDEVSALSSTLFASDFGAAGTPLLDRDGVSLWSQAETVAAT